MKTSLFCAVAALTLAAAAPALAQSGPEVEIRNAVARVVVMVEDRADVAVEVQQGTTSLPRPTIRRAGNKTIIDGELNASRGQFGNRRMAVQSCNQGPALAQQPGEGATVEVRGLGRINMDAAPLIIIHAPRAVDIQAEGAVFGAIGRGASSVSLTNGGCGGWMVANVDGPVDLSVGGSGRVMLGNSRSLDVTLGGSGSVTAGQTGDLDFALGGSGSARIARVDGTVDIAVGGSGEVRIVDGRATSIDVTIGGSGDVSFGGTAVNADVTIAGSGDVRLGEVTGQLDRQVFGSGGVTIGR